MPTPGELSVDTTQYDLARKRALQQNNAQLQSQKDALARRAAQTGGGVKGALIKQENIAANAGADRLANANEGINAQQSIEKQRVNEINTGRAYQTSERLGGQEFSRGERLGGQDFSAGQAAIQRRYLTGERESAQKFSHGERRGSEANARGMQVTGLNWQGKQANIQRDWQGSQADIERAQRYDMFAQQLQFSQDQFAHEQVVDQWNKDLADRIQGFNEKPGMLESIFSKPSFGGGSYGGGGGDRWNPSNWASGGWSPGGGTGTGSWM